MKSVNQIMGDTRKGFRRKAKASPHWLRIAIISLIFAATALVPAFGLAIVSGSGVAAFVSQFWDLAPDHPVVAVVLLLTITFAILLLMPLIKAAWRKLHAWDQEISMTKTVED